MHRCAEIKSGPSVASAVVAESGGRVPETMLEVPESEGRSAGVRH